MIISPQKSRCVMEFMIEQMRAVDWEAVAAIYAEGMATGNATFETEVPSWEKWDAGHIQTPRLVARQGDQVLGWAVLSPVSGRCVYSGVAENSIYIAESARGMVIGRKLLQALIDASEDAGYWTIQTGIFPENTASLALHEKCGFRILGRREKIGQMNGVWRDVMLLERR